MSQNALQDDRIYGKIIVTGERITCGACGAGQPVKALPGAVARGLTVRCKRCRRLLELNIPGDPSPSEASVH